MQNKSKVHTVSVIITTKNEERNIERLITSIKKQSYKFVEIIVVDNNSNDRTVDIVKSFGSGVNLYTMGPERSTQRNLGALRAKGEYLLFLDADMELADKTLLQECVDLAKKGCEFLFIPETSVASSFWDRVKAFERSFYDNSNDIEAARFFSKSLFKKLKGFDVSITGPEDWDLSDRAIKSGNRYLRTKARLLHHERVGSLFKLAKKKFYYAQKAHLYIKKNELDIVGPKTVFFLRREFYQNPEKLLRKPVYTVAMFFMLSIELVSGGVGYIVGKYFNK